MQVTSAAKRKNGHWNLPPGPGRSDLTRVADQTGRPSSFLRKLAHFEGLIIDDLGYVQQSREEMEVLFTLLAERYERGAQSLDGDGKLRAVV